MVRIAKGVKAGLVILARVTEGQDAGGQEAAGERAAPMPGANSENDQAQPQHHTGHVEGEVPEGGIQAHGHSGEG